MSQYVDLTTYNGLFKQVYSDNVHNMIPKVAQLQDIIKFVPKQKQEGNEFVQPLILQLEHGKAI